MTELKLQSLSPVPLEIVWHENKTTFLSIRKERGRFHLRLHRLFYHAPTPVLEALVRYVLRPKDVAARAVVKQMAHLHFSQNTITAEELLSKGSTYDLQKIYNRMLKRVPIEGVVIGWSKQKQRGKFRSLTFGSYDKHCRQIRINPLLDDPAVPLYFLEFIVYHEMLHALCPSKMGADGRCFVHTAEFRQKEREFPLYEKAKEWEKTSLTFFRKRTHGRS